MDLGAREANKKKPMLKDPVKRALVAEILIAAGKILAGVGESLNGQSEEDQPDEGDSNGL